MWQLGEAMIFRFFLAGLLALSLHYAGYEAVAQARPIDVVEVEAELLATPEGIQVRFALSSSVSEFTFDNSAEGDGVDQAKPLRRDNWRILDEGFAFDGLSLKRTDGSVFSSFTLFAKPDRRDYDRVYTGVFRMGEAAYGFYSRHFIGNKGHFNTRFCVQKDSGCDTAPFTGVNPDDIAGGTFMALGDIPATRLGGMTLYVSPLLDQKIADNMRKALQESSAYFADVFGFPAPEKSRVFLSYSPDGEGYRGSVAEGATMFVQLRGAWASLDGGTLGSIQDFIAHEVVHYWNGGLFNAPDNLDQPWLAEGAATYFAAVSIAAKGEFYGRATDWLNGCRKFTRDLPLDGSKGQVAGQAPYQCGAFIHWLLDEDIRRTTSGKTGVGDVWQAMFTAVDAVGDRKYSVKMFEETLHKQGHAHSWQTIKPLLVETGEKRWVGLEGTLTKLGYDLATKSAEDFSSYDLMGPVIFGLLNVECGGGPYSFYFNQNHLRFENGEGCGDMSGYFVVRTLDGIDFLSKPAEAFARMQDACKNGEKMEFGNMEGVTVRTVQCKTNPPSLPSQFKLVPL